MSLIDKIKTDIMYNEHFTYSYYASFISDFKLKKMQKTSDKHQLVERFLEMQNGCVENRSENRMVLHHLLRHSGNNLSESVKDIYDFYRCEKEKCYEFSKEILDEKKYKYFVQVGVGGSILGAKFLFKALNDIYDKKDKDFRAEFICNIDKERICRQLDALDFDKTLFIFATKSGNTKEIEICTKIINEYIAKKLNNSFSLAENSVLITSRTSPLSASGDFKKKFYIDNNIGGRFSVSSAMGILVNSIVYGKDIIEEFLSGMRYIDENSKNKNILENLALFSALVNYYEQIKYKIDENIISPYAEGLRDFPDFLSQLFMESLGKDKDITGKRVYYRTGGFFFGERGISCQHSFYQMLHNGTQSANIEFVAFKDKEALLGNCLSQSIALFKRNRENRYRKVLNKILYFDEYNAFNIGQLVAFYENKVMFLGFLYNVNSYDQEGVEFGKKLYRELENGENKELMQLKKALDDNSKCAIKGKGVEKHERI